jgi:UTP:GlnB (protein PII) uridylyltransferase
VKSPALLPIKDAREVAAFLQRVPLAVDRGHFVDFVLGFPHKYLATTPAAEVLKHYMLMEALRDKAVISSLSREGALSKVCLVARDRRALFSRLAGTLSSYGADIVGAEAFANANSMVLDVFTFVDPQKRFADDAERRQFQVSLERAVEGKDDVAPRLQERLDAVRRALVEQPLAVTFDDEVHPEATAVTVSGANHFGLLYLLSRMFAEGGYNIEIAYVETPDERVRDQFFLTRNGGKLTPDDQTELRTRIAALGRPSSES